MKSTTKKKHHGNCFFFAFKLFLLRGGYIAIRRSHNITGIHWLWSRDLKHWIHYAPIHPKRTFWAAALHKIWYRGKIHRGDKDGLKIENK